MNLKDRFLTLKRATHSITTNPLLDAFNLDELDLLDSKSFEDPFIAEKKTNILSLVESLLVDFSEKNEKCKAIPI
jgi:hypothetical protein